MDGSAALFIRGLKLRRWCGFQNDINEILHYDQDNNRLGYVFTADNVSYKGAAAYK